jgi:hypothetical protein
MEPEIPEESDFYGGEKLFRRIMRQLPNLARRATAHEYAKTPAGSRGTHEIKSA